MAGPEFKKGYNKGFEDGANSVEEGLPGWFGTFADMMTLLFAFFVCSFSGVLLCLFLAVFPSFELPSILFMSFLALV